MFDHDSPTPTRGRVTKVSLDAANTVFRTYLKVYPKGRYATSANGLLRRVAWLGGNVMQQADLYGHALARWSPTTSNVPLIQLANELDSKLLFGSEFDASQIQSPTVLATVDLLRMRTSDSSDSSRKPLTLDDLQAQKPRFANAPALYDYLLATWYVQIGHKPDAALALLPQTPAEPLDYFGLSQQALRGFALEDSGQSDKARQWRDLIPLATFRFQREALERARDQPGAGRTRQRRVRRRFAVQNAAIRAVLLQRSANADLLRAQAQNQATGGALRDTALYAAVQGTHAFALRRVHRRCRAGVRQAGRSVEAVHRGRRQERRRLYVPVRARHRHGAPAESRRCERAELSRRFRAPAPARARPRKRSGAAVDAQRVDDGRRARSADARRRAVAVRGQAVRADVELRDGDGRCAGEPERPRLRVLPRDQCYAPGGSNECGGKEVPKNVRKRWFDTLKASYAGSP